MRYEGAIYRPPGERHSYLLQVTVGCSHNACSFCSMYKDKRYHVRPLGDVLEDIRMAKQYYGDLKRVFLCDGDAIAIPTQDMLTILDALYSTFPSLERVNVFAGPRSTLRKTPDELRILHQAGLSRAYLGVETGNEELMKYICKGVTPQQMLEAGTRLRQAGFDVWAMVLLGLAGTGKGLRHCEETAELINQMKPRHLSLLSLVLEPGTRMHRDWEQGKFVPCTPEEILREVRCMVQNLTVDPLHFTCDHASNYLPLKGTLPDERQNFIRALDGALQGQIGIRPEWSRQV